MTVLQPHADQITMLTALARAGAVYDRYQLIAACGSGKTATGRWHAQAAGARVTVVFVPSLTLVGQTLGEWRRIHDPLWTYEALIVCSDASTAPGAAERAESAEKDAGPVDHGFWARTWANVTTDPARAAAAIRRALSPAGPGRIVIFSTYHSAAVVAEAAAAAAVTFDLAICDEAHHLAGRPREEFRMVLDDARIPARKRLFMTATRLLVDGDDDVLSMDDEDVFGPTAHTITFGQAIAADRLTDYQVLVIADERVDDGQQARRRGGNPDRIEVPGAVLAAASDHHLRSMLTYHTYRADARALGGLLDGITLRNGRRVSARHVSGGDSASKRGGTLRWLGEDTGGQELRLVTSARCLAEGTDVPGVDSVMFADPREAIVGIIQGVGRALRTSPGKKIATIIVPVTLPDSDDDTELLLSRFGHVWMVLRALRAHDERFAEELARAAAAARKNQPGAGGRHLRRVRFLLPAGVRLDENMLRVRMIESLGADASWDRFYALLCDYAEATGGAYLPFNKVWKGQNLGMWSWRQIAARKDGRLPARRAAKLEAVSGWAWDRADGYFTEDLRKLRALAESRPGGLAQPPGSFVVNRRAGTSVYRGLRSTQFNLPMGIRAAEYRQLERDGIMSDEQASMLEELPGWDWSGGLPADDVAMIQALREYAEFEHHADVPEGYMAGRLALGRWCWAVRRRRVTGRLEVALAEEIDAAVPRKNDGRSVFRWLHIEAQWRLCYSALRAFRAREGHARVPAFHVEVLPDAEVQLGQWCGLQRFRHRRGQLDPQFVIWMNAIEGWDWNPAGRRQEYGTKLDLGGEEWHGRPKGMAAGCKCQACVEARRDSDHRAKLRRDEERMASLGGPMPAGPAQRHLAMLERAGAKRGLLADLTGVPLGVIRSVANGATDVIARQHDAAIAAVTAEMVASVPMRTGSRGRLVTIGGERIPGGPTRRLVTDLQRRGFGMSWIARELNYATTQFLGGSHSQVTRRVADQVADLHARVGSLCAPPHGRNQKVPRLAELTGQRDRHRQMAG